MQPVNPNFGDRFGARYVRDTLIRGIPAELWHLPNPKKDGPPLNYFVSKD